ncbi:MAG: hypothetical protein ACD_75C01609G0004 [uncultured bacterium]|nr:MAG: hypothetical protein ACD_75C01609G0004 [uncultured bacterium]
MERLSISAVAQSIEFFIAETHEIGDLVDDGDFDFLDQFLAAAAEALQMASKNERDYGEWISDYTDPKPNRMPILRKPLNVLLPLQSVMPGSRANSPRQ